MTVTVAKCHDCIYCLFLATIPGFNIRYGLEQYLWLIMSRFLKCSEKCLEI